MDPNAVYSEMIDAYAEKRWQDAIDRAGELDRWLDSCGFPPNGKTVRETRLIAKAIRCHSCSDASLDDY